MMEVVERSWNRRSFDFAPFGRFAQDDTFVGRGALWPWGVRTGAAFCRPFGCGCVAAANTGCRKSVGAIIRVMTEGEEWPGELDALVAAPRHHRLLFENEAVRVLDTSVAAGETVPLHTHRWPAALYLVSWSDFVRRDAEGMVVVDSRAMDTRSRPTVGVALWSPALAAHTLENVGGTELRAISVEVKTAG